MKMTKEDNAILGMQIRALFARNLKRLRNAANMTQMVLAEEADLTHNFINDLESGKKRVSPETIAKLSSALKIEPYELFIPDSIRDEQTREVFSLYLEDIEKTHARMVADYRKRFLGN